MRAYFIRLYPDVKLRDREALGSGLRALFSRSDKPSALFVHDDYFAIRVMAELSAMGLRVPADVSIIAPGDILDYSETFRPADHDSARLR